MKMKSVLAKLSPLFESAIVVLLATIFVVSVTFAATTIGSSITTGGNVTATGWASTTNATTTDYVYVGWGVTAPAGFDYKGDLIVSDDAFINDQATTSKSLWVGSAGTANNLSMSGGDLYVQDDVEIDGDLWLVRATTTDSLYVGGNASTTGDLYVSGGTIDITTSTATTTMGLFVRPKMITFKAVLKWCGKMNIIAVILTAIKLALSVHLADAIKLLSLTSIILITLIYEKNIFSNSWFHDVPVGFLSCQRISRYYDL